MTATHSTADVLDGLYVQYTTAIGEHRDAHQHHARQADAAYAAGDPDTSGRERAYADLAMTAWTKALAAAAAIEATADALGVDLAHDRRRVACVCPEGDTLALCRVHGLDYG
jgi:hypothetical protein